MKIWRGLSQELQLNLFYSTRGHYTLAHTDATLRTCRWRAEVNKHLGVDSRVVGPEEIARALPMMDMTAGGHAPIVGALYHAPGAVARHDAVAWGYARAADRLGGRDPPADRSAGHQHCRWSHQRRTHFARRYRNAMRGVGGGGPYAAHPEDARSHQPIYVHPLQAMVSEPLKPWLDPIIVSGSLHVYVSQTARGELVMGASLDPRELHTPRSSREFVTDLCAHMLDLFPFLAGVKINRQWAGLADMTPDFAPSWA